MSIAVLKVGGASTGGVAEAGGARGACQEGAAVHDLSGIPPRAPRGPVEFIY